MDPLPLGDAATTAQCILHWATRTPHRTAVIEHDRDYSYRQMADSIARFAGALQASGVAPGALVGLECGYRYLHLLLILACEVIGAASLSFSTADVMASDPLLPRCDFLCLQTPLPEAGNAAGVLYLTPDNVDRIRRQSVDRQALALLDSVPADDAVMRLVRSSGSTGPPKVMAMSHTNMQRLLQCTAATEGHPDYDWNFLNPYNYTLRSAQIESCLALRLGFTAVSSLLPNLFADLRRFRQSRMTLLPGDAARLVAALPLDWGAPATCLLNVKGGALPPAIRQALLGIASDLLHPYATTETYRLALIDEEGIGTLSPGVAVRIVDDAGRVQPLGACGLIEARSPAMVDGYLWDAAATRDAFVDGWYRTSDIGTMPAAGRLVVLGRADDMLNLGGVKVAPQPLEQRITAIEGVADAVLLAEQTLAGTPAVQVVLQLQSSADLAALHERIAPILAPHVANFTLRAMTALPRTETGKVQRGALRRALTEARPT